MITNSNVIGGGGGGIELIWENPNPITYSSTFPAQTLTFDGEYVTYFIECAYSAVYSSYKNINGVLIPNTGGQFTISAAKSSNERGSRDIINVTSSSIQFGRGYDSYYDEVRDGTAIPTRIWGVRKWV